MASDVLKRARELIKKCQGKPDSFKVKYLKEVGRIRGEIFRMYRGKKMPPEVKKVLSELGKTFPPTLYRKRKKKK